MKFKMNNTLDENINQYCIKYKIVPPQKFVKGIINPGVKTPQSITDKVVRKIEIEEAKDFKLHNISDIVRGTIIIEDYSIVPSLIWKLKENIPNLYGYISSWTNGYKGIHLNFSIDETNAEIQIHTPESFAVNKATSEVYAKWRNYNPRREIENLLELKAVDSPMFKEKRNQFFELRSEYNKENQDARFLYDKLWRTVNLNKHENLINAVLFKINKIKSPDTDINKKLHESLYANLIDINTGLVDKNETYKNAINISLNNKDNQNVFVKKLTNIYENTLSNLNTQYIQNETDENIIKTINQWETFLNEELNKLKMNLNCQQDYCSFIYLKKFNFISNALNLQNGQYILTIDQKSLKNNVMECAKEIQKRQNILTNSIEKVN